VQVLLHISLFYYYLCNSNSKQKEQSYGHINKEKGRFDECAKEAQNKGYGAGYS